MGRALLYTLLLALALFVLGATYVLDGGASSGAATAVSVHDLSVSPEDYNGRQVSTEGTMRRLDEPEEHFVVVADGLAVVVRGYPARDLRRLDEQAVAVTGRFGFDEDGTFIEAVTVTALD